MLQLCLDGQERFGKLSIAFFCGRVLREVKSGESALRIEGQIIRAYKLRGQAQFNKRVNLRTMTGPKAPYDHPYFIRMGIRTCSS